MSDASKATLERLLDEGHEHERLDYKDRFDPDDPSAWVEIAKDVGAMQLDGGHIVLGATDGGVPTGLLTEQQAKRLDESRVRAKLKKWLAEPLGIRSAAYEVNGKWVALIHVAPSDDGFGIFKVDGGPAPNQVFRSGDVFARHGSASERWWQADIARIKSNLRRRENEESRRQILSIAIPRTRQVAGQADGLLAALAAASATAIDPKTVTEERIRELCAAVSPHAPGNIISQLDLATGNHQYHSVLQVMVYWRGRSRDFFNDVVPVFPHLEGRHITLLTELAQCSYFSFLDAVATGGYPMTNQNIEIFAGPIWKYVVGARALSEYVQSITPA